MSPGNPFILGVKRSRSWSTKTVPPWVFALLWEPVSSSFNVYIAAFC